jgi:hypothetical protein
MNMIYVLSLYKFINFILNERYENEIKNDIIKNIIK